MAQPKSIAATIAILTLAINESAGQESRLVTNLKAGRPQTIVAYGTSLTAQGAWVGQLQEAFKAKHPGLTTMINSGESGMGSKWDVDTLDARVIARRPDVVFIESAMNDAHLHYKTSVAEARHNLTAMIDRILAAKANTEIILITMNPPIGRQLERRRNIKNYHQMYRDVAGDKQLQLVDNSLNWERLLESDNALVARYVPDGVHPDSEGCGNVITPAILKALRVTAEPTTAEHVR
jgi:acyl-CoA thioesterase-1